MDSMNLQSEHGGGDGYRSPERLVRVSRTWMKVVSDENVELASPVVSVTSVSSPAKTTSSSSSPVHEKIVNASTDSYSPVVYVTSVSSPAETTSSSSSLFIQEQLIVNDRYPPIISVSSTAETTSSLSLIKEQVVNDSTGRYSPESASFLDYSGTGSQGEGYKSGSNAVKKPVWSKRSNVVEVMSSVMDAASWPPLGESSKAVRSNSSSESLQALDDRSLLPALQVTANSSSSSNKPASVNPVSTPSHVTHSGQASMRRGGGITGAQQSPASQESKVESVRDMSVKPATFLDSDPKVHTYKGSPRGGFGSQQNSGNDHHYQRSAYKRGYGGPHPRVDGSYHQNYGGETDHAHGQGHGYQEWNQQGKFNNRDTNMQPQRGGYRRGGYMRPSAHKSTPFIHPPMPLPVGLFGNNVLYPDVASGMIYFPGPPPPLFPSPFYFPVPEPLHDKIMKQIDFYFSNDNLVKDTYLRRHMDEQGWVPVNLIARFNKVSSLTDNVQLILDVMQKSNVVEVQGDKMRPRNDWMRWLMPPAVQELLGSRFKGIELDEGSQLQPRGVDRAPVA